MTTYRGEDMIGDDGFGTKEHADKCVKELLKAQERGGSVMTCEYCGTEHPPQQIANPHYCIEMLLWKLEIAQERIKEMEAVQNWQCAVDIRMDAICPCELCAGEGREVSEDTMKRYVENEQKWQRTCGFILAVMGGIVIGQNLATMFPNHLYEASWVKVAFAAVLVITGFILNFVNRGGHMKRYSKEGTNG